jgi:hypothetical protein
MTATMLDLTKKLADELTPVVLAAEVRALSNAIDYAGYTLRVVAAGLAQLDREAHHVQALAAVKDIVSSTSLTMARAPRVSRDMKSGAAALRHRVADTWECVSRVTFSLMVDPPAKDTTPRVVEETLKRSIDELEAAARTLRASLMEEGKA